MFARKTAFAGGRQSADEHKIQLKEKFELFLHMYDVLFFYQ